jgi:hypothetical protein
MILKGSWVQIHIIVLTSTERATQLPEETKKVPLEMWTKGFLLADCDLGQTAKIETLTGRHETGTLLTVNPYYKHHYGEFVGEILTIDKMVKSLLAGDSNE